MGNHDRPRRERLATLTLSLDTINAGRLTRPYVASPMKNRLSRAALALAAVCAASPSPTRPTPLLAGLERSRVRQGRRRKLSIDGYGRLTLGPTTTSVYDASAPFSGR